MCSHGYFYRRNDKQTRTRTTLKTINFALLRMSNSVKVHWYTSRISCRVFNLVLSRGRGVGGAYSNLGGTLIRGRALI